MQSTSPGLTAHVLDLHKVHRNDGVDTLAIDRITASFAAGVVTAVLGPSGAGKSTLCNILAGLDQPTSGEVTVGGHNLAILSDRELTRLRRTDIGLVLEGADLVPTLSTRENLLLPMSLAGERPEKSWYESVVAAAGLKDLLQHPPVSLTPTQQQLLATARALLGRPSLLLADEPTGRLRSREGDEVMNLLEWAREETSQAIVLFTHDPIVAARADRVLVLTDGNIVADMPSPTPVKVLTKLAELDARATAMAQG
ncbi:ATP-binding cassette domain-containing protein [Tessaracoccus rhinocerotis]|uniref:ATP-binding cassette domain-containing protein n=1 Tax=Tessaracoccus rhinocerotis TaxID=1689449 RepID=A0A553K1L6_9ACTN|nr:ATP-binding cassette domain-containing protein [Tessaracoccus rhinocerotis]TRY18575.1 ATP-binding cassette domain-containing protein [Tessaracoccus rhinocerotis]